MPLVTLLLVVALAAACAKGDDTDPKPGGVVLVTTTKAGPVRVTDLACQASLDALRSVTAAYFAANGRWPTRIGDLMSFVQLGGNATLSADGTVLSGVGWTATMSGDATADPKFTVTGGTTCR
jgi:hypothetical protein